MPIALLPERNVLRVDGADARKFLHAVLTNDMNDVSPERAGYGALLTPQGKIIADCLVIEVPQDEGGGFLIDVNVGPAPELVKKLTMFRLRAQVTIQDVSGLLAVLALWDGANLPESEALTVADPRLAALGNRAIVPRERAESLADAPAEAYHRHRIALGVPDGGKDFAYGDAFPHEALMDALHGVSFTKGCYVGQEVVSRMQHRGTARTRVVPVTFEGGIASDWGVPATAGEKPLGTVGSTADGHGLALLRLDRVADALAAGETMTGGGRPFTVGRQSWANFEVPGAA